MLHQRQNRFLRDTIYVSIFALAVFLLAISLHVPERLAALMGAHEQYNLRSETLIALFTTLVVASVVFTWRRWRELVYNNATLKAANQTLQDQLAARQHADAAHDTQEKQSQTMEAVGQLAGGIAHDFNNLLTLINGYSELLLLRLQLDDASRHKLTEIKRAGERAAGLTRQLLAFSRKQVLQPKALNLNLLLEDTQQMLRRVVGEEIELVTQFAPDLCQVTADPGQLEQVLMNLATNAQDAMPGGGRLTLETKNITHPPDESNSNNTSSDKLLTIPPGNYVLLTVVDTGDGMSEEVRARIFEPFFTTKGAGKGTGLGLSTVYGIVKQSEGFIFVESAPDAGTTFTIYLPRVEQMVVESVAKSETETHALLVNVPDKKAIEHEKQERATILLVEDETPVRGLMRETLEHCGYQVLEAANGKEALEVYERRAGQINLLLTDMVMPEMSGAELIAGLAARDANLAIVCMSGYTDKKLPASLVEGETIPYLQKPVSPTALVAKLREVLSAREVEMVS